MHNSSHIVHNSPSIFTRFVLILFLVMLGTVLASVLVQGLGQWLGMDYLTVAKNLQANSPNAEKNFAKAALTVNQLCTFLLPSIVFMQFIYREEKYQKTHLNHLPPFTPTLLGSLLLLVAFPLIQYIFLFNQQLPLPEWAIEQENLINQTIKNLLMVDGIGGLLINILIMGLIPSLGEELLFRGIIQQNLEKSSNNPHLAIWITAFIFSFIHFQFQGFFPRVLLGALLGYLFVWTRNLWIPIIAHFVYNSGQVLLQYGYQQGFLELDLDKVESVPIWLVGISILGTTILCFRLKKEQAYL